MHSLNSWLIGVESSLLAGWALLLGACAAVVFGKDLLAQVHRTPQAETGVIDRPAHRPVVPPAEATRRAKF